MEWVLFENRPALYFCNYKEIKKNLYVSWIPPCFILLNSIFDTESKNIYFMGSNKYIILQK